MSLLIKLRENNNFSNNEKIVAKYIFTNYKNIKNLDLKKISNETYTSIATITRMAKRLSYNGFSDLKLALIEELASIKNDEISLINNIDVKEDDKTSDLIEKISKLSIESLKETKLMQDEIILEKVANLINEKDVIDLYGVGASYIVCLDAEYKLFRSGKQTNTFGSYDKQYVQAKNSDEKHLAIIISYSGETDEMIKIAQILKEKNITTVSITRISSNRLEKICDYNIYATSNESLDRVAAIYSRISILNIIDLIYLIYYNLNNNKLSEYISNNKINKGV